MSNIARRSVVGVAGAALTGAAATITTGSRVAAAPGVASRPLHITVAAKDAPAYIEDAANYACTGTNDHIVINQAITAAATGPVAGAGPALRHRPAGREQDEEVVDVTVGVG